MIPMGKRVQIKPYKEENFIPSLDKKLVAKGEVVAIGDKCTFLKPGDEIYFVDWGVDSIKIDDEEHYFVLEDDNFILAKCGENQSALEATSTTTE